jgi:hypothetical protein
MSLDIEKVFNCLTNEEKAKIISGDYEVNY